MSSGFIYRLVLGVVMFNNRTITRMKLTLRLQCKVNPQCCGLIVGTAYRDGHSRSFGAPWFQEKLIVALLRPFSTRVTQSDNFLSAFDTHSQLIGLQIKRTLSCAVNSAERKMALRIQI